MRECEKYVDRLPDLLHERLTVAERERVLAHVRGCAECAAEHAWLRTMRDGIVAAAPRVDVAAIARGVHAKLGATPTLRLVTTDENAAPIARRSPPVTRPVARSWWKSTQLRAAAAVAIVAAGAGAVAIARHDGRAAVGVPDVAEYVVPIDTTKDTVVGTGPDAHVVPKARAAGPSAGAPVQVASAEPGAPLGVALSDLSDEELAAVLAAIDDEGGTLPADPAPAAPVVTSGGMP
jgi:hypothetical protein